jgi:hypothetical protein
MDSAKTGKDAEENKQGDESGKHGSATSGNVALI